MASEDRNWSSSGSWVLSNPTFQQWSDRNTKGHGILYLNGIPGAGELEGISMCFLKGQRKKDLRFRVCAQLAPEC